jgi:hypothetical protein
MRTTYGNETSATALLGYAADERGNGLVYARVTAPGGRYLLRLPFLVAPKVSERGVGYAATAATARRLRERGYRRVRFQLGDAGLATEMGSRVELPEALVLPYVRLRCLFNAFESAVVESGDAEDLSARARAEVALNQAA